MQTEVKGIAEGISAITIRGKKFRSINNMYNKVTPKVTKSNKKSTQVIANNYQEKQGKLSANNRTNKSNRKGVTYTSGTQSVATVGQMERMR